MQAYPKIIPENSEKLKLMTPKTINILHTQYLQSVFPQVSSTFLLDYWAQNWYNNSMILPLHIRQYFWGDNIEELNFSKHQKYIAQTILEKGDSKATSWLFSNISKEVVKTMLPTLKLSKKSENYWKLVI